MIASRNRLADWLVEHFKIFISIELWVGMFKEVGKQNVDNMNEHYPLYTQF